MPTNLLAQVDELAVTIASRSPATLHAVRVDSGRGLQSPRSQGFARVDQRCDAVGYAVTTSVDGR